MNPVIGYLVSKWSRSPQTLFGKNIICDRYCTLVDVSTGKGWFNDGDEEVRIILPSQTDCEIRVGYGDSDIGSDSAVPPEKGAMADDATLGFLIPPGKFPFIWSHKPITISFHHIDRWWG